MRSAPGNIVNGVQQGSAWGVESVKAGWADIVAFGSATTDAAAAANAASTRIRESSKNWWQDTPNTTEGAAKFSYDFISSLKDTFKNDSRVASDCAIIAYEILNKLGVKVKGTAVQNAWVPSLEKNAQASGFVQVKADQARPGDLIIFKTGNGVSYGAGSGMHAGVVAGVKDGQIQVVDNPGTQKNGRDGITRVRGIGSDLGQATFYRAPTSPFARDNTPNPASAKESPVTAAQIVRAQQLTAALEAAQAALKKDPKSVPLTQAVITATRELEKFQKASSGNAEALKAIQKEGAKTSGTYQATASDLKNYGSDALKLFKALEAAQATGSSEAKRAAQANVDAWIGESKAKKAVFDAEGAAYRVRQQNAKQAEQDQDKAAREREQHTQRAAAAYTAVQQAVRQQDVKRAQDALADLKDQQAARLTLEGKTAADRERIAKETNPRILSATYALNAEIKRQADEQVAVWRKSAEAKALGTVAADAEAARRLGVNRENERQANLRAQREQLQAVQQVSAQRQQEEKQLQQELSGLKVEKAEATAARLKTIHDAEIRANEGNLVKQQALIEKYAEEEYQTALKLADMKRDRRVAAAKGPNKQAEIDAANAAYDTAAAAALATRNQAIDGAAKATTSSIRTLREEYSKLAEGIREKVKAGTFDEEAQQAALKSFNALGRKAEEAGLSQNTYIEGARKSAWATVQAGDAAEHYRQGLSDLDDQLEASAQAQQAAAGQAIALAGDLDDLGDREGAMGVLNAALDAVMEAAGRGAVVGEAVSLLTGEIDRLNAALDRGALEQAARFLEVIRGRADQAADALAVMADQAADDKDFADRDTVRGMGKAGAASLLGFLGGEANSFFGERFWTELGAEGRDRFRAELGKLDSADFAPLGEEAIRGFIAAIGDDEEWAPLKALLIGRLTQIQRDFYQGLKPGNFENLKLPGGNGLNAPDSQNMMMPGGQAANYFTEWSKQLWDMGDKLKDPLRLDGIVKDLDAAYTAGKLTSTELGILKSIISSINAEPLEPFQSDAEKQFEDVVKQGDELVKSYETGKISLEAFANQAGPLSEQMERMAVAVQGNGEEGAKLSASYRDLAANLRNMLPVTVTATDKFDKLKTQIQQVGAVVQKTFALFGADNEVVQGIGQLTSAAVSGVEAFAKFSSGDIVGGIMATLDAVMNLGQAIDNLDPGIRAWKKSLLEVAEAEKKVAQDGVGMFKNLYADALKADAAAREKLANSNFFTRLWWGLTGTGPQVMSDAAAKLQITAAEIFGELGQTLSSLLDSSLMNAFEMGDFTGTQEAFEKSMNSLVAKMALKAIVMSSGLEEQIKAYTDARAKALEKDGISAEEQAELDRLMGGIRAGYQGITDTWQQVAPTLPGFGQGQPKAPPSGSIAALQAEISDLQQKLSLATTDAERDRIRAEIEAREKELTRLNGEKAAAQGSITELQQQLGTLQDRYNNATTQAERDRLKGQIEALQGRIAVMQGQPETVPGLVDTKAIKVEMPASITSSINFDVLSTLSSNVLTLAQALPQFTAGTQAFVGGVGVFAAVADRLDRLLGRKELDWGALR
ncbi:CHAP domain-containing protein [Deinococcus phoenicis]|uniref:CHAP domain-containing protein n=1 Tax=Deinococcus phoenicis TaxID=1476583 RepID=UPI00054DFEEC|nr:CHAP domain-containing protein [Deinococcus phoenicis]